MTLQKAEFENLLKKVDSMNELLIRNDEKLNSIQSQLKDGNEKFVELDTRIRGLESFKIKVLAYASVFTVLINVLFYFVDKFLK